MSALYAILIVGIAMASDRGFQLDPSASWNLRGWPAVLVAIGSVLIPLGVQWCVVRVALRRISMTGDPRWIDHADRAMIIVQWAVMIGYGVAVLIFGWGRTVQEWMGGDPIVVDMLVTMLPPLIGLTGAWWLHYPVMERLRHAIVIRALDSGGPIHEIPSRSRYVFLQARVNVLFLLAPLLLIATASEVVDAYLPVDPADEMSIVLSEGATLACAIGVLIVAPVMAKWILGLRPMPTGEIRDELLAICAAHRVRVRDILLWRTDGSMINAAVMGFVARFRYVMITDALLESLRREQVLAVMAHEVGHVRRHHMPWMIVGLLASLMTPWVVFYGAALWTRDPVVEEVGAGVSMIIAFFAFGWISRRFERQADTFAVQHLSQDGLEVAHDEVHEDASTMENDAARRVRPEAAHAMQSALEAVSRLNGIDPARRSWRHGSIRWRQEHLESQVGRPVEHLEIDRQVRLIKLTCVVVLAGTIAGSMVIDAMWRDDQTPLVEPRWPDHSLREFDFNAPWDHGVPD